MAYRDDQDALFERAEALQIEVDRLRADLERERGAHKPRSMPPQPPPIVTPKRSWWRMTPPPLPAHVPVPTDTILVKIDERLDRIGEPVRLEDLVRRVQQLDERALQRVSQLVDELLWNASGNR